VTGTLTGSDRDNDPVSFELTGSSVTPSGAELTAGFNVINGTRSVSADYPASGKYTLTVFSIGGGGSYYF
jgi:hypothetical protein